MSIWRSAVVWIVIVVVIAAVFSIPLFLTGDITIGTSAESIGVLPVIDDMCVIGGRPTFVGEGTNTGSFWVTYVNKQGQIVSFDLGHGSKDVLAEYLPKPTCD